MLKKFRCCYAMFVGLVLLVACGQPPAWHGTDVTGVLPDLDFQLIGEDGAPVSAADFRGRTTLLYFGFTHCPGVCPATLGHLAVAMNELGADSKRLQALLVTVDPARDTPEVLGKYTDRFGPWLHGLTGSEPGLKALSQAYRVDFLALPPDESGAYEVNHSNAVFAFDEQGRSRLLIRDTADTDALVSDLRRLLGIR